MVASLRLLGHDALYVAEAAAGLNDVDVIALASREKRILLTGRWIEVAKKSGYAIWRER